MNLNGSSLIPLIIGTVLLVLAMRILLNRAMIGAVVRATAGLMLLVGSVLCLLASMDLYSYRTLQQEESVAKLQFEKLSKQNYRVIMVDNRGRQYRYHLKGDQWQLDARLIRWHQVFNPLGFMPLYRLERLSGRYSDFRQEMSAERTVYQIEESEYGVDIWSWLKRFPQLSHWIDTQYGSATFLPMANGAIFEVNLGFSGLSAHPVNNQGAQAVSGWQ